MRLLGILDRGVKAKSAVAPPRSEGSYTSAFGWPPEQR
jgi:hypothetical protein